MRLAIECTGSGWDRYEFRVVVLECCRLGQTWEGVRISSINFFATVKTKIGDDKFGRRGSIEIM